MIMEQNWTDCGIVKGELESEGDFSRRRMRVVDGMGVETRLSVLVG